MTIFEGAVPAALPAQEARRQQILDDYEILDTLPEQQFDDLTLLASQICGAPIALISLVDRERQWFKSRVGLDAEETHRDLAFCAHAIHGREVFVVGDTLHDDRFSANPLVRQDPKIRFYAGAPLVEAEGQAMGTICVIDRVPRELTPDQTRALEALSRQVVSQMELRKKLIGIQKMSESLYQAKSAAEDASRTKSRFLAHMSHELRTPLNAIIGFSSLLRKSATEAKESQFLERISANGRHLLSLIDSILDLSQIEAGRIEIRPETFDGSDLIREVTQQIEPLIAERNNELETHGQDAIGDLHTDPKRLRQCLLNLLSNACKFTDKGRITLTSKRYSIDGNEWIEFEVADTGIGMDEQQLARLFQEFARAESAEAANIQGSGLGLAITRRLCGLMGGDIDVVSEPDAGSRFTMRLPVNLTD